MSDAPIHTGTVFLVGAGPGDPELITVRGWQLLHRADVVVYDRLVHPSLIEKLPPETERIFVGKSPGYKLVPQDGIHELLIERARQGYDVVRLKGGDPFVFGRGGEECLALQEAGIPFEIVPGVSSAISVPAYAGIPVTHRGLARGFSVMTGFTKENYDKPADWPALANAGTLVILMGLRTLPDIVQHLLDGGQPENTPVAVVSYGTTRDQEVVTATLSTVVQASAHLTPPATVVVGDVVHLHAALSWFDPSRFENPEEAGRAWFSDVPELPDLNVLTAATHPVNR